MFATLTKWIKKKIAGLLTDGVEDTLEEKAVAACKTGTRKLAEFAVAKGLDAGKVATAQAALDGAVDKIVPLLVEAGVAAAAAGAL